MELQVCGLIKGYDSDSSDIKFRSDDSHWDYGLVEYIQRRIEHKTGVQSFSDYKRRLGRNIDIIHGCSLRLYFTDKPCTLEDADILLVSKFEGNYYSDKELTGYSEFTITGYDVNKCEIGGHGLVEIIRQHIGEYMILVMEWSDERW